MKGMVFTEFYSLVETLFGEDMVDDIIEDANLDNDGAFTAVGTYNHEDLVKMVLALSKRTDIPAPDLIQTFGTHLFQRFTKLYPIFFTDIEGSFEFLKGIEDIIHAEVLKLYPDATLPKFDVKEEGDALIMVYHSKRHFQDLAHGLILGAGEYFGDNFTITRTEIDLNTTAFKIER